MQRTLVIAGALFLVACDFVGPKAHLDGVWHFRFDDMTDGVQLQCQIPRMDMRITQTGSSFRGIQLDSAQRRCFMVTGDSLMISFADDTLVGTVGRMSIAFSFVRTPGSTARWADNAHSGSVDRDVMLGYATWSSNLGHDMTGTFAAFREPH